VPDVRFADENSELGLCELGFFHIGQRVSTIATETTNNTRTNMDSITMMELQLIAHVGSPSFTTHRMQINFI
jgi:hypothetical protein